METALRLATTSLKASREEDANPDLSSSATRRAPPRARLAADVAAIDAALRATKRAARAKKKADRRLAAAILGHARAEGVDLGLDPASDLATRGGPAHRSGSERKHGSVPVGEGARVVAERVAGKRCVVS